MRFLISVCASLALLAGGAAWAGSYEDALDAATNGQAAALSQLLARGIDPDTTDQNGNTLLILAARDGHADVVEVLLKYRASTLHRNLMGDSAPMLAALRGHREVIQKLIASGRPLESDGWTPLMYAAFEGHAGIAQDLIAAGASLNARAPNKATPLMLAARNGHIDVVRALLAAGADQSLKNDRGQSAADWALEKGNTDIARLLIKG
ncbi:MAG: ankyrin repeat domain-containing protein [Rhodocyclaceae bacterium]|nr:ankyrin repeat domain-containing protein [Rhodocyclaceae bacterium]